MTAYIFFMSSTMDPLKINNTGQQWFWYWKTVNILNYCTYHDYNNTRGSDFLHVVKVILNFKEKRLFKIIIEIFFTIKVPLFNFREWVFVGSSCFCPPEVVNQHVYISYALIPLFHSFNFFSNLFLIF